MQSLAKTINKILGLAFVIAAVAAFASFQLMSQRVLREAEAEAEARAQEILNGQMADLTRALHEGREMLIKLKGEILVANYRHSGLAIGVYTRDKSAIYESASELDLGALLLANAEHSAVKNDRVYVWKTIELGRETLGHVVLSTAVDQGERDLVARSLLVSVLALLVAMTTVFVLSRTAIQRRVVEPLEQINSELPRLQAIVDGTMAVRSSSRADRDGATDRVNRSVTEIARLRAKLFDFSLQARASSEAHRLAESELSRSQAIHDLARQTGHDIRSPLAALETILLSGNAVTEDRAKILRLAVKRIQGIASHLLGLEKSHEPETRPPPLSYATASSALLEVLEEKRVMAPAGIELCLDSRLPEMTDATILSAAEVPGDDLRRVLSNLLANSLEATPSPGTITVTIEQTASGLELSVTDTGCGIAPAERARVFEQGFTHGKAQGHGLGLAHAKDRVTAWGGRIDLMSTPGKGTTVRLILPSPRAAFAAAS